jgi:transportin-1
LLKNGLGHNTNPSGLTYVKGVILQGLGDKDQMIRQTVGAVITALLTEEDSGSWPEALNAVTQGMGSPDINLAEVRHVWDCN